MNVALAPEGTTLSKQRLFRTLFSRAVMDGKGIGLYRLRVNRKENRRSRPERTQISCPWHSQLPRMRLSLKESRMKFTSAAKFNRKSGGAEWRDLRFLFRFSHPSPKPLPRGLLSKDRFPLPARGDQSHAVLHP